MLEIKSRYVLSTDLLGAGFSSHWAPFWRSCTPCHFSYDIIMKVIWFPSYFFVSASQSQPSPFVTIYNHEDNFQENHKNSRHYHHHCHSWRLEQMILLTSGKEPASTVRCVIESCLDVPFTNKHKIQKFYPKNINTNMNYTTQPGSNTLGEPKQWKLLTTECRAERIPVRLAKGLDLESASEVPARLQDVWLRH